MNTTFYPRYGRQCWWPGILLLWLGLTSTVITAQSVTDLQKEANGCYQQDLARAVRLFERARQLAMKQGQPDWAANVCVDEATAYYKHDDYRMATSICQAGLRLTPLADSTQFKLWASLGEMYHQRNRPDSLARCWQRADALLAARSTLENAARTYVAAFWGNRGTAYFEQGDYRMAERCFQKRLLLLSRHSTPDRQAIAENQFAYFFLKTAQPVRADSLFRASLNHYSSPDQTRGWLLLGLVDCRLQENQPQMVGSLLTEARRIARQAGADGTELVGYVDQAMGQYWLGKHEPRTARIFFWRSLKVGERLGRASQLGGRSLLALSQLAQRQGNTMEALRLIQRAIQKGSVHFSATDISQNPAPTDFLNGSDLFEWLCWKAHLLHLAKEKLPDALVFAEQTYKRAFALSDVLQDAYSSELTKLFVRNKLRLAYREAIAVAYDCYRQQPSAARLLTLLHWQERGNASVLHETQQELQNPYLNAPPRLLEQIQHVKIRLSAAKTNWIEKGQTGTNKTVETELVNAELAWSRVYHLLHAYRIRSSVIPDCVALLQKRLPYQTAFLQYSLTADSLLLTVVTAHHIRVLLLPVSLTELNHLIVTLRSEASQNPDPFPYSGQASAQTLFQKLIRPVWADLDSIQRIVMVRDGPLHYLPMEVLETGLRPNDYLLRYVAITYAYSMNSLVSRAVVQPHNNPSVLSMAPFAVDEITLPIIQQQGYKPLAGTEKEALAVAQTHSVAGNASKRTFLNLLPNHEVLHLATHAEASETNPDEAYIAFFPDGPAHRLYAHELELLDLRHVRLTVLSACRTGSGALYDGDGLLSLSWAFTAAGCPQVITSLWKTHDGATEILMELFYDELRQGKPTDVALQQAKLRFLTAQTADGEFSPPHFWAHLILMGDYQPVYVEPSNWFWLTLGIICGLLSLIAVNRLRHQR